MVSSAANKMAAAALVLLSVVGCESGLDAPRAVACRYEVQVRSSCSDAEPVWARRCAVVADEAACSVWTRPVVRSTASCEYTRDYRSVEAVPDEPCDIGAQTVTRRDVDASGRLAGEPCDGGDLCTSGLCAFGQYCTVPCERDSDCADALGEGCCVGGSEGQALCLDPAECRMVCGANAHPVGVPTRCVCDDGYIADATGQRCVEDQRRAPGEPCTLASDCHSDLCLVDTVSGAAWCSLACQGDDACAPLLEATGVERACCVAAVAGNRCAINNYCP